MGNVNTGLNAFESLLCKLIDGFQAIVYLGDFIEGQSFEMDLNIIDRSDVASGFHGMNVVSKPAQKEVDLYDMNGTIIGKHTIDHKRKVIKEIEENDLDALGNIIWEDDLDPQGNLILEEEYKIRYISGDGTLLSREEYTARIANSLDAYMAAFVGCTYHCG